MKRPTKYGNVKTVFDGKTFDSKKEARRYSDLRLLERAGEIHNLDTQVVFPLNVAGKLVCKFIADFTYVDNKAGELIVEDVKSPITRKNPTYRLKNKLFEALHGFKIREV